MTHAPIPHGDYRADTEAALAVMAAHGQHGQVPGDVDRARADTAFAALIGARQLVASATTVTMPRLDGLLALRVYRPSIAPGRRPGLIYFHGGGFVLGSLGSHDAFLRALTNRTGRVVIAVDYRLAPEHPFPAAIEDGLAALNYVRTHADIFGIKADGVAIAGDSAGANLATVLAQLDLAQYTPPLTHQVLITPQTRWPDTPDTDSRTQFASNYYLTTGLLDWFADCYLPDRIDRLDPRAAPGLATDLTGLPAATVVTAEFDPLCDEGEQYAADLATAGVDVALHQLKSAFHLMWLATAVNPSAQREVLDVIAERLGGHAQQ